jgi:prophage tail gpP-like protein
MSRIIVQNTANGKEILWRHISVKKSLDDICHTLALEIPAAERAKIHKHDKIEVRCEAPVKTSGGKPRVTTVMTDEITAGADISKHSVKVTGRSPARDIIDSTWGGDKDGTWLGNTLFEITTHICGKFGITCGIIPRNQGDITAEAGIFAWENESPWSKLITEGTARVLFSPAMKPGIIHDGYHLTEGRNVKTIEWKENGAGQYHEYVVTGGYGEPARVIDSTCKNNRVLTIDMTNPGVEPAKLQRRAETEMRRRRENRVTVTVPGWGLTDTQIKNLGETGGKEIFWVPNLLIPVSMPSLGLEAKLLISEAGQEATPETMSSGITLVNKEAYL